jgi:hypothetical protein
MEHVKSAGSLQSAMVNPERSVVIGKMKHLLKTWMDDQAQRHIPASQAIISAKAKSTKYYKMLNEEKRRLLFNLSWTNSSLNRHRTKLLCLQSQ